MDLVGTLVFIPVPQTVIYQETDRKMQTDELHLVFLAN